MSRSIVKTEEATYNKKPKHKGKHRGVMSAVLDWSRLRSYFRTRRRSAVTAMVAAAAIVMVGVFLVATKAATSVVSTEPETGTLSAQAKQVADATASGGQAVKFTAASGGSCPVSTLNVSGGPDGSGGCWPGAGNTGIPSGTTLSAYTGSCSISSGTVTINAKDIKTACGAGHFNVYGGTVTITNSLIGTLDVEGPNGRVTVTDSELDGGAQANYSAAIVYISNTTTAPSPAYLLTMTRVNAHSGKDPLECVASCYIKDSWLHTPYYQPVSGAHQQAILNSGGGPNSNIRIEHNLLSCDNTDGCTADLSIFGDFNVASGVTVTNNLFEAHPEAFFYCTTFGYNPGKAFPNPDHIVVTNNVLQKGSTGVAGGPAVFNRPSQGVCGQGYPISSWMRATDGGTGNVWSGNKWDDGTAIPEPITG